MNTINDDINNGEQVMEPVVNEELVANGNVSLDNAVGSKLLKEYWENWWKIYIQLQKLSNDDIDLINKKKECIQAQLEFENQYDIEKAPKIQNGGNISKFTSMVMNPSKLFTKKIGGIKKRKTKKRRNI